MSLTVRTAGHVTILDLEPVLTYASGAELVAHLEAASADRVDWLLNMAGVSYIDSAGLGALLDTYRRIAARGGALKMLHVQPRGLHLLAITGLAGLIQSFDSEPEALSSFIAPEAVSVVRP